LKRYENAQGRFTLSFLAVPGNEDAQGELTYNWDAQKYPGGRNFGHIAYPVDNIYESCQGLMDGGVTINRRRKLLGSSDRVLQRQDGYAAVDPDLLGRTCVIGHGRTGIEMVRA
jgi:catechol 2,3-dioxygenase-like lactoylglutathione lyase family enzyme